MNKTKKNTCLGPPEGTTSRGQKTSTPIKDKLPETAFNDSILPNISVIPHAATSATNSKVPNATVGISTELKKPAGKYTNNRRRPEKNVLLLNDADKAFAQYNITLQEMFLEKLTKKNQDLIEKDIDGKLAALRLKVAEKKEVLSQTKLQIKRIEEIQNVKQSLNQFKEDIENVSGILNEDSKKINEKTKNVAKQLDIKRNVIACTNISIPETVTELETFHETVKETLSTYETLSKQTESTLDGIKEVSDLLQTCQTQNEQASELEKCLPDIVQKVNNSLVLEAMSKTICHSKFKP